VDSDHKANGFGGESQGVDASVNARGATRWGPRGEEDT